MIFFSLSSSTVGRKLSLRSRYRFFSSFCFFSSAGDWPVSEHQRMKNTITPNIKLFCTLPLVLNVLRNYGLFKRQCVIRTFKNVSFDKLFGGGAHGQPADEPRSDRLPRLLPLVLALHHQNVPA